MISKSGVSPSNLMGVGVGFAGHVNGPEGLVLMSANLPEWNNVPLRDIVAERLEMPVVLDNDTNLCALASHLYGAGHGIDNMCYVTLSTGYGLGIIIDGKLYVGHNGTAGEIAHTVVEPGGATCPCGKQGYLMAYASGLGLARMAYERIASGADTVLREMAADDPKCVTGEMIAEAARRGDIVARELWKTAGYYAGIGLSTIVQVVNPEALVIGGGLTRIGPMLMEPCLESLEKNVCPALWESVRIIPWELGDNIGLIGAAAAVFLRTEELM